VSVPAELCPSTVTNNPNILISIDTSAINLFQFSKPILFDKDQWDKDEDGLWVPPKTPESSTNKPTKETTDNKHKPGNGKSNRRKGRGGGCRIH
jgi:hypothetical protein